MVTESHEIYPHQTTHIYNLREAWSLLLNSSRSSLDYVWTPSDSSRLFLDSFWMRLDFSGSFQILSESFGLFICLVSNGEINGRLSAFCFSLLLCLNKGQVPTRFINSPTTPTNFCTQNRTKQSYPNMQNGVIITKTSTFSKVFFVDSLCWVINTIGY